MTRDCGYLIRRAAGNGTTFAAVRTRNYGGNILAAGEDRGPLAS